MEKLEKILEEIEQKIEKAEKIIVKPAHDKLDEVANDTAEAFIEAYKECQDIIRKYMENDGWISVNSYGLPSSSEHDFRFWVTIQYKNGFRRTLKATWNYYNNHFVYQNGKIISEDVVAYRYYSAPKPYQPERSEG